MNRSLTVELAQWKPQIEVAADPQIGVVNFTCKYGKDGFQQVFTNLELAEAQPEVLQSMLRDIALKCATMRTKTITDMIRPVMQKAADYSKVSLKGK